MEKTESVIERVKNESAISGTDQRIMEMDGVQFVSLPSCYRHKETGEEFWYLEGGIGWPRDPKEKPGFAVIVGVYKTTDSEPPMKVLEEVESPTIKGLLKECVRLQIKYGGRVHPELFRFWYGDQERADTFVNLFNFTESVKEKDPDSIYLAPPYDFERKNAFERFLNQIWTCLQTDVKSGEKKLQLGSCDKLRNWIHNTLLDSPVKGDVKDFPAIAALGGVVHVLVNRIYSLQSQKKEKTVPTLKDDVTAAQEEYDKAMRDVLGDSDFEEEYDDTGELKPTID